MNRAAFLDSERPNAEAADALFHLIPVPWERSVSYGRGAAFGPAAIIEASRQLEVWTGRDLPLDRGIHSLPPINCRGGVETVLGRIEKTVRAALELGKLPVLLGGEHTVSLGAFRALPKSTGLVQIDAHADLRDRYENDSFSHACVMRRACDLGLALYQAGVRALSPEEVAFRAERKIGHLDGREAASLGLRRLDLPADFPREVYLSFDLDGLDPSIIPETGTPEPGGLGWYQALDMIESIAESGRRIVGFDVVELAPSTRGRGPAVSSPSAFAAARLVYEIMGVAGRRPAPSGT